VATRRPSESPEEFIEDENSATPDDQRPKTGRELYKILTENGLIGMWKDRTDIGDTLEFVQRLKDEGRERRQEPRRKHAQD
jgi:predicted nucleic acid-binding protein